MKKSIILLWIIILLSKYSFCAFEEPKGLEKNGLAQNSKNLTEADFQIIKRETLKKMNELGRYIKVLTDKTIKNKNIQTEAVNNAVKLFQDEDKVVQVSSVNSKNVTSLKVRSYFNKIRVLNYSKIEIEWYDIEYVSDLREGTDGKYYCVVHVFQKITDFIGDNISYTDYTQKNIEIVIGISENPNGGLVWVVYLGDISVVETKF